MWRRMLRFLGLVHGDGAIRRRAWARAVEIRVTGPEGDTLESIARELVEARLVACANVEEPSVASVYRWEGAVETARERRMVLHTRAGLLDEVVARVRARHPYDVPAVTVVELVGGDAAYLAWVVGETT